MKPCFDPLDAADLQQRLSTPTFGRTLYVLAQTASTNDVLKTLAQQGAPEGTVVLAEQQTQGRGRQGRTFVSPAGVGIYLSLLLRPHFDLQRLPQLTLLVAVAVAEALSTCSALPIRLKWPNDILIGDKKLAGILTEGVLSLATAPTVIVGIGINVNTTLAHWPPDLQPQVTSLALASGHPWARAPLIVSLLSHLEGLYHTFQKTGLGSILPRWLHYGPIVGRRVRFTQDNHVRTGIVQGLDDDGALLVQDQHGVQQRLITAEVMFL